MNIIKRAEAEIEAIYNDETLTAEEQNELVREIEKDVQDLIDREVEWYHEDNNVTW